MLCKPKSCGGVGFRDLVAFNKALLVKQIWRIIILYPDSLLARILKARYFKNSDIMLAKVGSKPSYVWRSLLWSRNLLKRGLCWRVGNGKSIDIFNDPWIPNLPGFRCGINTVNDLKLKVESLIHSNGSLNENLVRSLVNPFEANAILQIPIHMRGCDDIRYWISKDKGHYIK